MRQEPGVAASDPSQRLVELVRAVGPRVTSHGCPLRNVLAEFPDRRHPVHQAVAAHFIRVRARLRELAAATPAAEPDRLADRVMIILDGLSADGPIFGDDVVKAAVAFAEDVLLTARPR